ncbi:MAG: hypothetical protein ACHQEM_11020, partial [Chitinophagales bacterium]
MICHNDPSINFKAFVLLTIFPGIYKNVLILVPYEDIDPKYNAKSYEIQFIYVIEFVFTTHSNSLLYLVICTSGRLRQRADACARERSLAPESGRLRQRADACAR